MMFEEVMIQRVVMIEEAMIQQRVRKSLSTFYKSAR